MARDLLRIPCRDEDGRVHVVVEAPRGARVKLRYDPEMQAFVFHRALVLGVTYPFDWGFAPSTKAPDGDPLDAMVIHDGRTWPGVVIPSRPIGVVRVTQRETGQGKRTRNDRIILVPTGDDRYAEVGDLPRRVREELESFFVMVTTLLPKQVRIEGWEGSKVAEAVLEEAVQSYARGDAPK